MSVTDLLDLIGLLLIIAAVALAAGLVFLPLGVGVGGVGLLGLSWLIDRKGSRRVAPPS